MITFKPTRNIDLIEAVEITMTLSPGATTVMDTTTNLNAVTLR